MNKEKFKVGQTARLNKLSHREGDVVEITRTMEGSNGQVCDLRLKATGEFIGSYHSNRIDPLPVPEVGDTVKILEGLFKTFTGEVTKEHPDKTFTLKLVDEGRNATLTLDGRYLNVIRKARTVGETIKPQYVRIGDTIEASYIRGDVTFTRVGIVGNIDKQSAGLHFRIGSKQDTLIWDLLWKNATIKLLAESEVDVLLEKFKDAPADQIVTDKAGRVARKLLQHPESGWEVMVNGNVEVWAAKSLRDKMVEPKFMKEEK